MSLFCYTYYLIILLSLLSAILIILVVNPVVKTLFLILSFTFSSFLMIHLSFIFIGFTYIIVYVGAIIILFLFVIMMVGLSFSSPEYSFHSFNPIRFYYHSTHSTHYFNYFILTLFGFLSWLFTFFYFYFNFDDYSYSFLYFNHSWIISYSPFTDLQSLGYFLYLAFPFCLFILGFILFIVMIGIINITHL